MNIGDNVQLKAGGPVMTVIEVYNDPSTAKKCAFFTLSNGAYELRMVTLPAEALKALR